MKTLSSITYPHAPHIYVGKCRIFLTKRKKITRLWTLCKWREWGNCFVYQRFCLISPQGRIACLFCWKKKFTGSLFWPFPSPAFLWSRCTQDHIEGLSTDQGENIYFPVELSSKKIFRGCMYLCTRSCWRRLASEIISNNYIESLYNHLVGQNSCDERSIFTLETPALSLIVCRVHCCSLCLWLFILLVRQTGM